MEAKSGAEGAETDGGEGEGDGGAGVGIEELCAEIWAGLVVIFAVEGAEMLVGLEVGADDGSAAFRMLVFCLFSLAGGVDEEGGVEGWKIEGVSWGCDSEEGQLSGGGSSTGGSTGGC